MTHSRQSTQHAQPELEMRVTRRMLHYSTRLGVGLPAPLACAGTRERAYHPVAAGEHLLKVLELHIHAPNLRVAHAVPPAPPKRLLRRVGIPAQPAPAIANTTAVTAKATQAARFHANVSNQHGMHSLAAQQHHSVTSGMQRCCMHVHSSRRQNQVHLVLPATQHRHRPLTDPFMTD